MHEKITSYIKTHNLVLDNIIREIAKRTLLDINFDLNKKIFIIDHLAEIQYQSAVSLSQDIYINSLISVFILQPTYNEMIRVV